MVPWQELGTKPSPFENKFFDPSNSIISIPKFFGKYLGLTEATTEVNSIGSKLAMHTEENFAQALNYNHGPGIKLWIVIESRYTVLAGYKLGKYEFKGYKGINLFKSKLIYPIQCAGACCGTFNHRDVIFDLRNENIPYTEILQHPGDIVYLPPGVLHTVTNISGNNYWQALVEKKSPCRDKVQG